MRRLPSAGLIAVLLMAAILVSVISAAQVADDSDYGLSWWTVDGGGGSVSGDGYTLRSTAGQPDAGAMADGAYTLSGGFWGGAGPTGYTVYLPVVAKE